MKTNIGRLIATETKLFLREPIGLIFVFAFPALTVLILGGVFAKTDPSFGGATPSDYYIAAYISVVLSAVGFIMLPVHLAAYRERGVLRRFHASHFPPWALPVAWIAVASALSAASIGVLLATARVSYGIPAMHDFPRTIAAVLATIVAYISTGVLLGLALPTARSAQGVGLALFFPSFLLCGGGPPPDAMPPLMRTISNALPMAHAARAIQHPWLSIGGSNTTHFTILGAAIAATTIGWLRIARGASRS
jgi:ABC-2 type transport system permease protein